MMAKEVTERYMEALENLTNSKIEINTLTVMATEDEKYAQVIVDCIEARLRKVPANQTLPLMYLIDSICKNHGSPYKEMFNHNLVFNFAFIFKHVCKEIRSLLYELRSTWEGIYQVFPPIVLHQLDLRMNKIDPAWPVTYPKPTSSAPVPFDPSASKSKTHINPAMHNNDRAQKKPAKARRNVDASKTSKIVFLHVELLRSSSSSALHLTQLAASIYPSSTESSRFFTPVLPSILVEYLDNYKVHGDLMEAITMKRDDNGTFLFRPPVMVEQVERRVCVSEREALCSFLDFLEKAGPNIILVFHQNQLIMIAFSQVGLDEDSVGVLMLKLQKVSVHRFLMQVDGYTWWRRVLESLGSK